MKGTSMTTTSTRPRTALLSHVPTQQLHWLWQHYIPLGHLTLLEGSPGMGISLLALHLAACVTAGQPLPDGTPCPKGGVVLVTAHDGAAHTIKPRLEASGGDPNRVVLLGNAPELHLDTNTTTEPSQYRPFDVAQDLSLLESLIHFIEATLVIIDPITIALSNAGLAQRFALLTQLSDLAQRTGCAILLLRPVSTPTKTQLSSPTHLTISAARDPILTVARSRLLLLPDPFDKETLHLHCTKHCLGPQPPSLGCLISSTEQHNPIILWLGEPYDPIAEKDAASYSRQRQDLLDTLRQSDAPLDAITLSRTCIQSYHALRKMLQRLVHEGQLVSPARGLFTTPGHLCLLHFPPNNSVPNAAPTESELTNFVAAQFIAPVEPNGSTPSNPPTTTHSHFSTNLTQPPDPNPPSSESHVPNVPTTSSIPIQPSYMSHPSPDHPDPQSVPNVATNQTQQPQLDASDLYPSVMIRPRKEPEIYPGW
jgi:hypothetical protein